MRHGQTPSNVAGLLDTAPPGPELTEFGAMQAAAAAQSLADEPISAIFASNAIRAQQTAAPLATARKLPVQVDKDLREIQAGFLEMAADSESIHRYIGALYSWLEGDLDLRIPGGPTGHDVLERFDAAVDNIAATADTGGSVVTVSHGAMIRVWASVRVGSLAAAEAGKRHMDNTGAVIVERTTRGTWDLKEWREAALGGPALDKPEESGPTA